GPIALAIVLGLLGKILPIGRLDWLTALTSFGWIILLPILTVAAILTGRRWRSGLARIEADSNGVTIHQRRRVRLLPLQRIPSALVVLAGRGHELEIGTRDGHVFRMTLPTSAAGDGIVNALGFGKAGRRVTAQLGDDEAGAGCVGLFFGVLAAIGT